MILSAVPIATVALVAVAWALPLAWWSAISSAALVTAALAFVIGRGPAGESQTIVRQSTTHAALCVWAINAIGIAYAVRALVGGGDRFTRLGYPFLVTSGLTLAGGTLLLILVILVSLVPVFFRLRT
jgi:hypothetical protein